MVLYLHITIQKTKTIQGGDMMEKSELTKKQQGFVNDVIKDGNATKAALNNYDIKSENKENVAGAIGSENLRKPKKILHLQLQVKSQMKGCEHPFSILYFSNCKRPLELNSIIPFSFSANCS